MNDAHESQMAGLVARLAENLTASSRQLVTAESCTGGWLAKLLTDRPGSSAWYCGGVVVYSNELKMQLLNVRAETLAIHGAVSEATVREMAMGALRMGGAMALATSGIAGPGGGTTDKPVGTVWHAWAWFQGGNVVCEAECQCFAGDRDAVRRQTVNVVLEGAIARLDLR